LIPFYVNSFPYSPQKTNMQTAKAKHTKNLL